MRLVIFLISLLFSIYANAICFVYFKTNNDPLGPTQTLTIKSHPGKVSPDLFYDELQKGAELTELSLKFKNKPEDHFILLEVTGLNQDIEDFSELVTALLNVSGTGSAEYFQ